ncbi:TlyA family RNA methyltransferase [Candidatus Bipolaricaulota bacterium]|nr:TlyA family RNA methyltransferase [Candidatus Bipolaricaulota bacterium]
MPEKERLDLLLTERGLCKSREKAKREIMAGNVYVSGQLKDKPGKKFPTDSEITVKRNKKRYASRGGKKLEAALEDFDLDVTGYKVLDIGASTGGFTDCLLRKGAERVWALDVGKGQLDWNLRQDDRVTPIEGKNARYLKPTEIGADLDLVTIDVSFISLELILPNAKELLLPNGKIIALVKPQFEAGPEKVEKGGVVTDPETHKEVLIKVAEFAGSEDLSVENCTYSPIQGKSSSNIEYFFLLSQSGDGLSNEEITGVVNSAHDHFS